MMTIFIRNWRVVVMRGIASILFGVTFLIWPGLALEVLVILFGAYALIDGLLSIIAILTNRDGQESWWVLLLEGIVGIAAGIFIFLSPSLATNVLIYVISFWAIVTGLLEIVAAIQLREEIEGEWLLIISGILSTVFGVLILLFPAAGATTIAWLIGLYAVIFGILFLTLGLRLRKSGIEF